MKSKNWFRLLALLLAFGMVAAACGSDDEESTDAAAEDTAAEDDAAADDEAMEDDEAEEDAAEDDAMDDEGEEDDAMEEAHSLADVCPSPLVIQTDWFAEAEHGALYEMIGEGYTVDAATMTTTGPGQLAGEPLGIDIEVRMGGPAIGFAAPRVQMYTDDSIHLGYTTTDSQATAWNDLPLIAVVAPLEINPQIIMWDADAYPEVETIADVGTAGITVNVFGGGGFSDVFVAQGIWSADQVDPSYDGSPARFIAEGNIAQQGFASAEPFNYEFVFEEYGKAPAFQLLHDAGFQVYSQTIGVKPSELENLRPCLEEMVPIIQQSAVNFSNDPARANAVIVDAVEQVDSFWVYTPELAEWSVAKQVELGLVGNGPDGTVGNMDAARIQKVIDDIRAAGLDVPEDLTAEDMFTNEFIDETIGR